MKWAKCNVGAEKETDAGLYFAWGETTGYTASQVGTDKHFSESDYKYGNSNLTKYNQSDGKTVLDPEDDAATQIMGEGWRMPTQSEFQELIDNTNKKWTTINGVNGYKFTSNKEGYQNNSIFFPAAGDGINDSVKYVGDYGYVWSSSLYTSDPDYAWYLHFNSGNCNMSNFYRYYGKPVRGVRK